MRGNLFHHERAFYAIILGQIVSTVGSGMTRFGVGIWVFTQTNDASAYSRLLFFAVLPLGLGSLVAGPVVDRLNRKRVMLVANVVASASTLGIALLFFNGNLATWHLYVALFVNGIANAFILPALDSSVPLMVPKEQLGRASGLTQLVMSLEAIAAPALAGLVIGILGLGAIFVVDFVTFSASIIALALSAVPQPVRGDGDSNLWRDFVMGVQTVRARPSFVYLMGFSVLVGFLLSGIGYGLVTPLVLSFSTEAVAGLVVSAFGAGAVVGGVGLAVWGGPKQRMLGMLLATALAGIGAIMTGLRESAVLVSLSFFIIGVAFVFILGLNRVIWQLKAAPDLLGRIFSLRVALSVTTSSLGILIAGPLAEGIFEPLLLPDGPLADSVGRVIGTGDGRGIGLMFIIAGAALLVLAVGSLLTPTLRELEQRVPDYLPDEKPKRTPLVDA